MLTSTSRFECFYNELLNEPAHEIMVLITKATSKVSGEPAHSAQSRQSLCCSHTCSMEVDEGSDQKSDV